MKSHTQDTSVFECGHLPKSRQIQTGSFYTPEQIVHVLHNLIAPYKKKAHAVILDNSAGAGAFMKQDDNIPYKAVEWDPQASALLNINYPQAQLFMENALQNPQREKYHISHKDFLIQIGNPPYNDVTSAYRNGKKGENISDPDLFDRDIGISFLKSYNKLKSDVVCVLHPLSYLIKQTNFRRLGPFRQNYRLKKGILFSSQWFKSVSSTAFPILIGLYIRSTQGMSYNYIQNFGFSILNQTGVGQAGSVGQTLPVPRTLPFEKGATFEIFPSYNQDVKHENSNMISIEQNKLKRPDFSFNVKKKSRNQSFLKPPKSKQNPVSIFKLNQYSTVDSFIRKYPPSKTSVQVSDIKLYYWTFRDINSLFRNKGFHTQKGPHSIVVNLENFYQYAYLLAFKKLFRPQDLWLYGNLSPLGDEATVRKNKNLFATYTLLSEEKLFSQVDRAIRNKIRRFYSINKKASLKQIEQKVTYIIECGTRPSTKTVKCFKNQHTQINFMD